MSDTLFTLNAVSTHVEEIKKSRFEAVAASATSVEQALKHIEAHSDPTATHNCWAWRVGDDYR
ncbi:MAG TPA: YigZ family protein, partial [Burkholderiaceae bacterium]|nr:YigZ family protein [Burkholderiaceae bacterium]